MTAATKALVVGLGKTGVSVVHWLQSRDIAIRIADTRAQPPGLSEIDGDFELICGAFSNALLNSIDEVYVSPGIPGHTPLLEEAEHRGLPILSDIDVFAREVSVPVIGVTGSNGKSTVVTLATRMINHAGLTAVAGGNLGVPVISLLEGEQPDVFVLELSSFQLQRTRRIACRAATVLNLTADHLDWHGNLAAYRDAKQSILAEAEVWVTNRAQPDLYPSADKRPRVSFGLDKPAAGQFGRDTHNNELWLFFGEQPLLGVAELFDRTESNQCNALAALALVSVAGVDPASVASTLRDFEGLAHRRQTVARVADVTYINDSKATNVGAAIASIRAVEEPLVLIAGGDAKGAKLEALVDALHDHLAGAVLIGQCQLELAALLRPLAAVEFATSMADAVARASRLAESGTTVLLAPACASQDMFIDYADRGQQFVDAVMELAA